MQKHTVFKASSIPTLFSLKITIFIKNTIFFIWWGLGLKGRLAKFRETYDDPEEVYESTGSAEVGWINIRCESTWGSEANRGVKQLKLDESTGWGESTWGEKQLKGFNQLAGVKQLKGFNQLVVVKQLEGFNQLAGVYQLHNTR